MFKTKYFLVAVSIASILGCKHPKISSSQENLVLNNTPKNVMIYEASSDGIGPCEPSIYINPVNTENIVAGSVLDFVHTSDNGGKTWNTKRLSSSLGVYGDPCIVADTEGTFYYLHLSDSQGKGWESEKILDQIVIQRSKDGGKTWSDGTGIGYNPPKQQDKEWAAINPITNEIYVTWTEFDKYGSKDFNDKSRILFSKSSDRGETWTKPITISEFQGDSTDGSKTTEGAVPSVNLKGEIFVSWSYDQAIYINKSVDGGKTWWDKEMKIVDQPGGWSHYISGVGRSNGLPVTAVDNSNSIYSGNIYVNWTDYRNGEQTDVFIIKSKDGGKTWSDPIQVNPPSNNEQFFTWMTIDSKTGNIYIVYYDKEINAPRETNVVLAVSRDGGENFSSSVISQKPFGDVGEKVFFGDYNNIHAYDSIVRPIWTRYENGKLSVWTALIEDK